MLKDLYAKTWRGIFAEFDTMKSSFSDDMSWYSFHSNNEFSIEAGDLVAQKTYHFLKDLYQAKFDEVWQEMIVSPFSHIHLWLFPMLIPAKIRSKIEPNLWLFRGGSSDVLRKTEDRLSLLELFAIEKGLLPPKSLKKLRVAELRRVGLRDGKTFFADKEKESDHKNPSFIYFDGDSAVLSGHRLLVLHCKND